MTVQSRLGNIFENVAIKAPVLAATTTAITLSGEQTVDGVALVEGDRCLVKNQASAVNNGLYAVSTGNWQRTTEGSKNTDFVNGTQVLVAEGTVNAGLIWILTCEDDPVVIGTSLLTWEQQSDIVAAQDSATSSSSVAIGTGTKVFSIAAGKGFVANQWVLISETSNLANKMLAQIVSYAGTTLTVTVVSVGGSGTHADWTIALTNSPATVGLMPPLGSGDVVGPGAATDNGFVKFDGTTGKLVKNSAATVSATDIASNAVITAKILDNNVTLAKLATQTSHTILANLTSGAAVPTAATYAQILTALGLAASPFVSATDFGAVADCHFLTDATINASSTDLTSASNPFVSGDVGKTICVANAKALSSATVTMTIASPCVVTDTGHGLSEGAAIVFTTSGALPTGITAGTVYYVKSPLTNSYNISATQNGSNVNTSGSQSGVHTRKAISFLKTTIASFSSSGHVVLTLAADVSVAGVAAQFGTDNTSAINNAVASLSAGGTCYLAPGYYMATSINLTHKTSVTFTGAPWGVNNVTDAQTGSVLVPIDGSNPLVDCTGSAGLRVQDLQLGSTKSPVTGRVGIMLANSATRFSDAMELRNIYVTYKWSAGSIYCFAVGCRIWHSRFWNYLGTASGFAGVFFRDNHFGLASNYQTISTGTGNPATECYECEFHDFNGGVTLAAAVYLRGVLNMFFLNSSFDSSSRDFASLLAEQASATDCSVRTLFGTYYTESGNSPKFSFYTVNTIFLSAWENSYTNASGKKGGGGTFNFTALETT